MASGWLTANSWLAANGWLTASGWACPVGRQRIHGQQQRGGEAVRGRVAPKGGLALSEPTMTTPQLKTRITTTKRCNTNAAATTVPEPRQTRQRTSIQANAADKSPATVSSGGYETRSQRSSKRLLRAAKQ